MPQFFTRFKKITAGFTVLALLFPTAVSLVPARTHAQSTTGAACGVGEAIGAVIRLIGTRDKVKGVNVNEGANAQGQQNTSTATWTQKIVTCVLKPLAQQMVVQLIRQVGASVVNWINTGGEGGKPLFATDLQGIFENAADVAIGQFIEGSELGFLCRTGGLDLRVRTALAVSYATPQRKQLTCTLSDIQNSVDYSVKNWDEWLEVTTNPQNNFYGAYLIAQNQLAEKVFTAVGIKDKKIAMGAGFLDQTTCTQYESDTEVLQRIGTHDASGIPRSTQEIADSRKCLPGKEITTTPGSVIAAKLNSSFAQGDIQAAVADEIDEIVAATLTQLGKKLVEGANGLLGLSQNSSYSYGTPYRDRVRSTYYGITASSTNTTSSSGTSPINQYASEGANPGALFTSPAVSNINNAANAALAQDIQNANGNLATASTTASDTTTNIAPGHPTSQISNGFTDSEASRATDGIYGVTSLPPAITGEVPDPWWQVNLEGDKKINSVRIWKPVGKSGSEAIGTIQIIVRDVNYSPIWYSNPITITDTSANPIVIDVGTATQSIVGRYVQVQRINNYSATCRSYYDTYGVPRYDGCYRSLMLDEVEIISPTI